MSKTFWRGKTDFYPINKAQTVRSAGCVSIALKNIGTGNMIINGVYVLEEGATFTNSMPHPDMMDDSEYRVTFADDVNGRGVAITVFATSIDASGNSGKSAKDFCVQY